MSKPRREKTNHGKRAVKALQIPVANHIDILPANDTALDESELMRRAIDDATAAFKKFAHELR